MAWCLPVGICPPARAVSLPAPPGPFVSFPASSTQAISPIPLPIPVTISCSWAACTGPSPAQGSSCSVPRKPPPLSWGPLVEVTLQRQSAQVPPGLLSRPHSRPGPAESWGRGAAALASAPGSSVAGRRGGRKGRKGAGVSPAGDGKSESRRQPGLWEASGGGAAGWEGWAWVIENTELC